MYISFTGVYNCTQGKRLANAAAYPAKIHYWDYFSLPQGFECDVSKFPIIFIFTEKTSMDRWPVAKETDFHFLNKFKIFLPIFIVRAFLQLVHAVFAIVNRGCTIFNS